MNGRYSLITLVLILMTTRSYAESAILPPLPDQKTATSQTGQNPASDVAVPTQLAPLPVQTPTSSGSSTVTSTAPRSESVDPVSVKSPVANTINPADKAQSIDNVKAVSTEEHESFIDMGKSKLPSINGQNNSQSAGNLNTSDLRVPIIDSDEKPVVKAGTKQQANQVSAPDTNTSKKSDSTAVNDKQNLDSAAQLTTVPNAINQNGLSSAPDSKNIVTETKPTTPTIDLPETHTTSSQLPEATSQEQKKPQEVVVEVKQIIPDAAIVKSEQLQNPHEEVTNNSAPSKQPQTSMPDIVAPLVENPSAAPIVIPAKIENKNLNNEPNNKLSVNDTETKPLTQDHIKFINDETIVFTLNDDDIELGKLTSKAKMNLISGNEYIKLFWQNYNNYTEEMRKKDVDLFLAMYESHLPQDYDGAMDYNEAGNQAFEAASSGKLSDLRAIITNYPVIQMRSSNGDNLLNAAIESDNIDIARLLLIHGINMRASNFDGFDAFSIAQEENNDEALILLNKARHKSFK